MIASASRPGLIRCPSCFTLLSGPWDDGAENVRACERCLQELRITIFPPLYRVPEPEGSSGVQALEGEATCFFHPEKRAERACDRCGRFLCALCDLPVGARHLCPSCLKAGDEEKAVPELVNRRVSWGRLSLILSFTAFVPLLGILIFVSAPASVFLAIYGWNRPGSLVHGQRRISATFAILIGLAQIAGIIFVFYAMFKGATTRAH